MSKQAEATITDLREDMADTGKTARKTGVWATAGAAAVAAGAAVGAMKWCKARQTPKSRAKRAWKRVTDRFS